MTGSSPALRRQRCSPSKSVKEDQARAHRRDRVQALLLAEAKTLMDNLGHTACPYCTVSRCIEQKLGLEGPRHEFVQRRNQNGQVKLEKVIDHASSLWACDQIKGRCIKCQGFGHGAYKCYLPKANPPPYKSHNACKACTLQVQGEPVTHTQGHNDPKLCDAVGKNFIVEFCLALYHRDQLKRLFSAAECTRSLLFIAREPEPKQILRFLDFIYAPICQGATISRGLVLLLYGCRQRTKESVRSCPFNADMLRCILVHSSWENNALFQGF